MDLCIEKMMDSNDITNFCSIIEENQTSYIKKIKEVLKKLGTNFDVEKLIDSKGDINLKEFGIPDDKIINCQYAVIDGLLYFSTPYDISFPENLEITKVYDLLLSKMLNSYDYILRINNYINLDDFNMNTNFMCHGIKISSINKNKLIISYNNNDIFKANLLFTIKDCDKLFARIFIYNYDINEIDKINSKLNEIMYGKVAIDLETDCNCYKNIKLTRITNSYKTTKLDGFNNITKLSNFDLEFEI